MAAPTNPLFAKYAKKTTEPVPAQETIKEVQATVVPEPVKTVEPPKVQPLFTPAETKTMAAAKEPARAAEVAVISETFDLIAVDESDAGVAALNALFASEGGNRFNLFPAFEQVRGNQGGMLIGDDKSGPADVINMLPVGNRPFHGQYITHRFNMCAWSNRLGEGSSDADAGSQAKAKPVWDAIIGPNDVDMVTLMSEAGATYGKTKTVERGKFDGYGHMSPAVEVLFFLPDVGFAVFRGVAHYKSTSRTVRALYDACLTFRSKTGRPTGGMIPFPVTCHSKSTDEQGAKPWKCHSLDACFDVTMDIKKVVDAFTAFSVQAKEDTELRKALEDWRSTNCSTLARTSMQKMLTV